MNIRVKNSGIVRLTIRRNLRQGNLIIAEAMRNIPFPIRRVYFMNRIKDGRTVRGGHAHKTLTQAIFSANGSFTLNLDDGQHKPKLVLHGPDVGIILGPKLWHTMSKFSKDCVVLVLASDHYRERDYIRDYDEFLKITKRS